MKTAIEEARDRLRIAYKYYPPSLASSDLLNHIVNNLQ
jgi:hypothetical protein